MRVLLLLLIAMLAGCIQVNVPSDPVAVDDRIVVRGTVIDGEDGEGIPGAEVRLAPLGGNSLVVRTNSTGGFQFRIQPAPCALSVTAEGYASGSFELDCTTPRQLSIRLGQQIAPDIQDEELKGLLPPPPEEHVLAGRVVAADGTPLRADVEVLEAGQIIREADDVDMFEFLLEPGEYAVTAKAACSTPTHRNVTLQSDAAIELVLGDADTRLPPAPTGLATVPGPGPGHVTLTWDPLDAEPPISHYEVLRDGAPYRTLGNAAAWADAPMATGDHDYALIAVNICGHAGPASATVTGAPLAGEALPQEVSVRAATGLRTQERTYAVLDAGGNEVRKQVWRTVQGVGNCCETYVAASSDGRLFEYGGSYIHYSDDKGAIWSTVDTVLPPLGAEGAIVQAPGGDMLAFNWDPYTGDRLWVQKYVAGTDTWYEQEVPLHQPFYDRPWIAVVEGPFTVGGIVAPYASFVMSNYVHGQLMQMSLDGLHYLVQSQRDVSSQLLGQDFHFDDLGVDPQRDWTQAMRESHLFPIDDGQGLWADWLLGCGGTSSFAALDAGLNWACGHGPSSLADFTHDDETLRVDSQGALHRITAPGGATTVTWATSTDGGDTWSEAEAALPGGLVVEDWDVQARGGLDLGVVAVHASTSTAQDTIDQDLVFKFRGLDGTPRHEETLLVGKGDHVFGGGLNSAYDRFDYTTVAVLPDGTIALSFGDSEHVPPGVAITL